jgi:Glycosyltransferase family 87
VATVSHGNRPETGFIGALRRLRDPLLLFVVPVTFALLLAFVGYRASWPIGFDFRGTLWEPARALLDGTPIYPEPTREAMLVGNPTVYPPPFIVLSVPLALLPVTAAAWLWFCVLGVAVLLSMWILGIGDWRCYVVAVTSPVVVHGLYYGNLTILLLVPLALAWRFRDRAQVAGLAVGAAVAAKLLVWPLIVWLLLTRRFRAAAWAVGSGIVLVVAAWAVIGFQGFSDYPALLRENQDVYALRSLSLATVGGALGLSLSKAVAASVVAGLLLLGLAAWLAPRIDGERRSFAIVVAACVVATPIVWPNYAALLLVPIAITWPRLAPAWFFGYLIWLVDAVTPNPVSENVCCRPPGVTEQAWAHSHAGGDGWFATGLIVVSASVAVAAAVIAGRDSHPGARPTRRHDHRDAEKALSMHGEAA